MSELTKPVNHEIAIGNAKPVVIPTGATPQELAGMQLSATVVKRYFEAENPDATVKQRKLFQAQVAKAKSDRGRMGVSMLMSSEAHEMVDIRQTVLKNGQEKFQAVWKTKKKTQAEKDFDNRVEALVTCCGMTREEATAQVEKAIAEGKIC